jgi:hypothetical protein
MSFVTGTRYGEEFRRRLQSLSMKEVISGFQSPWQNAYVERLIGSIRRECLDHVVVLSHGHLRRLLKSYMGYYHGSRTPWISRCRRQRSFSLPPARHPGAGTTTQNPPPETFQPHALCRIRHTRAGNRARGFDTVIECPMTEASWVALSGAGWTG